MHSLVGPVFTIFTPFAPSGEIDYAAVETYIQFLADNGANQFYMMPYNGRYSQLTDEEIRRLNEFCIRCVKSDPNNIIIVSDPIHGSSDTKLEFAKEAKRHGADYLSSLMREKYFTVEQVVDHYVTLSRSGIRIVAHAMPFLSGYTGRSMNWPEGVFSALTSVQAVEAIKEDSKDPELTRGLIKNYGERFDVMVAGRKRFLVETLPGASHAYVNGVSMLDPEIAFTFWSLLGVSAERALEYVAQVDDHFWEGPVAAFGWHRVNKASLESRGLMSRRERRPMPELAAEDMPYIERATQQILDAHRLWVTGDNADAHGKPDPA